MSFQMGWHKEKRIVKLLVYGEVSLAETRDIDQAMRGYLTGVDQSVHVLFEVSQMTGFPANIQQLKETLSSLNHRRMGWIVFIDEGTTINSRLLHIFSQLLGDKYRTFSNLKLGMDFLKLQDPTLAWMHTAVTNMQSRYANGQTSESFRRPA
jgi:hypothetical protein